MSPSVCQVRAVIFGLGFPDIFLIFMLLGTLLGSALVLNISGFCSSCTTVRRAMLKNKKASIYFCFIYMYLTLRNLALPFIWQVLVYKWCLDFFPSILIAFYKVEYWLVFFSLFYYKNKRAVGVFFLFNLYLLSSSHGKSIRFQSFIWSLLSSWNTSLRSHEVWIVVWICQFRFLCHKICH